MTEALKSDAFQFCVVNLSYDHVDIHCDRKLVTIHSGRCLKTNTKPKRDKIESLIFLDFQRMVPGDEIDEFVEKFVRRCYDFSPSALDKILMA